MTHTIKFGRNTSMVPHMGNVLIYQGQHVNFDLQKVELNTSIFLYHFPCACLKNESFPMDAFLQKWPVAPTSEKCYVKKQIEGIT